MRLALSLSTSNRCQVTLKREEGADRPRTLPKRAKLRDYLRPHQKFRKSKIFVC